jgi:DNA-binding response OmpR family regulator
LLTDIVMPNLDGIALALKVAKEHPSMPVLLMTGYAAERQRAHNLDVLIHDVITKPFTLREILWERR